ncbi:hypothetical protein NLI96_g3712 [Meripilus lineatus]|uniref:Cytochrome P450 n=1 Tax=Meripilus lineatus TaxID=2056292 RepID=A0AAD5V7S7_9APHY|nr:hypothetical protein NLI96_g3712 [Physisporinus lineatus]
MNLNDMLEHAEALTVMGKSHATHEFPPANIHKRLFVYWEWATFGSPKMIELTSIHPLTYAFLLGLGFVVSAVSVAQRRRNIPLPPGPSQVDIVPDKQLFLQFYEFGKRYSPVFSLKMGKELFIIITGYKDALDILQKQGVDVEDRPRYVSAGEIASGQMRVVFLDHGERLRRAFHDQLQPSVATRYQPLQFKYSKQYIVDLLRDPDRHMEYARKYTTSVILSLAYGRKTPTHIDDPEVNAIDRAVKRVVDCFQPGAYLVDTFPILKYIPIPEIRTLRQYHQDELALFRGLLDVVRQQIANKEDIQPSFASYILERQRELELSDDETAYLVGEIFGAGADTTASAISFIAMAAACFPGEQAKVQEQIDNVVGDGRLPTFEDQEDLPLVTAFMLETHRWRPVSTGVPHRASKDIIWNGYVIPKGATVIGDHWSILRDPEFFPDPEIFRPERWFDKRGGIRDDVKMLGFGFGRRVCPGQPIADRSVWINAALLLWSFKMRQDPSKPIDDMGYKAGITAQIHPFKLIFEPRHQLDKMKHLLTSTVE